MGKLYCVSQLSNLYDVKRATCDCDISRNIHEMQTNVKVTQGVRKSSVVSNIIQLLILALSTFIKELGSAGNCLSQFGKVFRFQWCNSSCSLKVLRERKGQLVLVFELQRMGFVTCGPNEALVVSGIYPPPPLIYVKF